MTGVSDGCAEILDVTPAFRRNDAPETIAIGVDSLNRRAQRFHSPAGNHADATGRGVKHDRVVVPDLEYLPNEILRREVLEHRGSR